MRYIVSQCSAHFDVVRTHNPDNGTRANSESYSSRPLRKVLVRKDKMIQHETKVEHRENETWEIVMEVGDSAHNEERHWRQLKEMCK